MNANKLIRNKYSAGIGPERFDKELEWLNDVDVPTVSEIAVHQRKTVKDALLNRFKSSQDIINQINADVRAPQEGQSFGSQYIDMAITEIEQALDEFTTGINDIEKINPNMELASLYELWITQLDSLAMRIGSIYNRLANDLALSQQDIQQLEKLSGRFATMINDINSVLSSHESKEWRMAVKNFWTGGIGYRSMTQSKGFIGSVRGIINGIKGSAGELLGKNWINSLPHINDVRTNGNVVAVQMGDILGDIYRAGGSKMSNKQLTTDIALFDLDMITDNVLISITVDNKKQEIPLKEFLVKASRGDYNSKKVILQDETYAEYMLAGVQAKMGQNQKIYNLNSRTKISLMELQCRQAEALKALDQALKFDGRKARGKSYIAYAQEHDDYNALFNYSLASQIVYLLGKDNAYILTREGLQYIPDYLENNNYYFYISGKYKLGTSNTKYQINYGSANS